MKQLYKPAFLLRMIPTIQTIISRLRFSPAGGVLYVTQSAVNITGNTYVAHNTGYDGGEKGQKNMLCSGISKDRALKPRGHRYFRRDALRSKGQKLQATIVEWPLLGA